MNDLVSRVDPTHASDVPATPDIEMTRSVALPLSEPHRRPQAMRQFGQAELSLPAPRMKAAFSDLRRGAAGSSLSLRLAWNDVRQRYRRSVLGPFWLTLSMGLMVLTLGVLYAQIFHIPIARYLPFLTIGLMVWGYISTSLAEGAQCFIQAESMIRQIRVPLSVQVYRTIARNLIILAHNFVIYLVVAVVTPLVPDAYTLLAVPGLALLSLNLVWMALLLGTMSARFRDVPPLVSSLLQIVLFATPIMWDPQTLGGHSTVVAYNPVYHAIQLVRAPLFGEAPTLTDWGSSLGGLIVGSIITFLMFARFRERLPYWL